MIQQNFALEHRGMTLRGTTWRPAVDGRVPTVLLLHGFTGHRIETGFMFVQLARAFVRRGIAAVTFDFLHSGESDGSFDQMLVTGELDDALRMTQWLQHQPFADRSRLGLLGISLGGMLAACVSARAEGYKALTLLCPTDVDNLMFNVCKRNQGCPANTPIVIGPYTLHPDFDRDINTLAPVQDVARKSRPTLVVHGTGDTTVPHDVGQRYVDALRQAGIPVTLHHIPGADHGFSAPAWREDLLRTVVEWNAATLA